MILPEEIRCNGIDFDVNGLVSHCPERHNCLRYIKNAGVQVADGLCGVIAGEYPHKIRKEKKDERDNCNTKREG